MGSVLRFLIGGEILQVSKIIVEIKYSGDVKHSATILDATYIGTFWSKHCF